MSPTAEKKPMDVTRVADSPVFAVDTDTQWKTQRKLKHQRDMQKRANANNANNSNARRSGPTPTHRENGQHSHGARSIPGRRKDKHATAHASPTSPMLLSRSVPMAAAAHSWPPEKIEDTMDPNNWSLDDGSASLLATSAPESSRLSRSFGAKREARTMTLFESAMIFNEAGNLLSHENFDAMASSPELGPQSGARRKAKRRVGRHRPEKKKGPEMGAGDRLSPDDVVLELMHVLLPDMDVTKELNMLFLGGSRHQGEVFHFEDDYAETSNHQGAEKVFGCKLLTVDVRKFKASFTKLLFDSEEAEVDMPSVGSTASELIDQFLTEQWIVSAMLRVVKLDVLTQYDAFAVLLAVYRALPSHRGAVLKSLVGLSLAIYDHQAMERLQLTSNSRKLVSMKGAIALLNAILVVTEMEIMETPEVFGDSPEAIDDALDVVCERVIESAKLLMRSAPGGAKYRTDSNNHVEKFQEGSDSVEATTYSALGEVICRLAAFSPLHGQDLLAWMLRKWPQRNVQLQLYYVRFITGILMQFLVRGVSLSEDVTAKAFSRLRACIKSPHFLIAKEAASVCGNLPLMDMYLSRDQELREQVSAALHSNATSHWNDRIRELSDEYFDLLLDFA